PDTRLDQLAAMSKSKNVVHAAVEVVDIGGLVEGASKGEGLGNKFLANIREVDAIVFVLRAFVNDDITGPTDPLEHLRVVELELALADLETVEKRLNQATRQAKLDRSLGDEVAALRTALNDAGDNVEVIGMCVQLEAEAAAIEDPAERAEMLEGFGLGEGALFRMVRAAYHLLG